MKKKEIPFKCFNGDSKTKPLFSLLLLLKKNS